MVDINNQEASRGKRGHPNQRMRSGPNRWNNRPGVDRVVADKAKTYCPRLEGLAPWFLRSQNCLDTYELLNRLISHTETRWNRLLPDHSKKSTIAVSRLYIDPAILIAPFDSSSASTALF